MSTKISAEEVAEAEAALLVIKAESDRSEQILAMQTVAELRYKYRTQQEAMGARSGLVNTTSEGE